MLILQLHPIVRFLHLLKNWQRDLLKDADCPKATVILVVRGKDPFLSRCIESIIDQDYPKYSVLIIVDHETDPAWNTIKRVVDELGATNARIESLKNPMYECTLNCSSLVQALGALDEDCNYVAVLDADVIAHRSWLRELVTPLARSEADLVSGQRWYMPLETTIGTTVRYIWNAVTVATVTEQQAWGGSFAMTRKFVVESGLIANYRSSMGSDSLLARLADECGFRFRFVPSVTMVNQESCNLLGFYNWLKRQLLVGRLYIPRFPLYCLFSVVQGSVILAALITLMITFWSGEVIGSAILSGALLAYLLVFAIALAFVERAVRRIVRDRIDNVDWVTWRTILIGVISILPLTQFVILAAMLRALFLKEFDWRGVSYRVAGPSQIQLIEYRPFQASCEDCESITSI